MILIPRCQPSSSNEYWDKLKKETGCKPRDWCGKYHDLSGILHKYIKPTDKTLVVGGSSSHLSQDLYDIGYHSLINIDSGEVTMKHMEDQNHTAGPDMRCVKMDPMQMDLDEACITAVLDNGWLDSIMTGNLETDLESASRFFTEVHRILKIGGRYLCISMAADHIAGHLLMYFAKKNCMIRLHKVTRTAQGNDETLPPVFVFICTKFKVIPGMFMPLEICLTDTAKPQRVESREQILTVIGECKHYALVRQQLQTRKHINNGICVELYDSTKLDSPRYFMHVVDSDKNFNYSNKFAVFITPQGRETEWMFCSENGRGKLAESAGFERLVVVALHRDHSYTDMDSIKAELSTIVMELAPPGVDDSKQVPFLSIGDDIGQREVLYRGSSECTGDFVVEDVKSDDGHIFRRLLFLNGTLIQSQARLKNEWPKKRRQKNIEKRTIPKVAIDYTYLEFNFHKHFVAGLAAVPGILELLSSEMHILIVGLGAGILPMFLHRHFPKLLIDVVELDGVIVDVAKSCFEFVEDERMKIFVADGLEYITRLAEARTSRPSYHVIIFDVDAKDLSTGLNSPPRPFIEKPFLNKVDSILHPQGLFMVNLISRDEAIKQDIIKDIKTIFPLVYTTSAEDEVNETLYAISRSSLRGAPEYTTTVPPQSSNSTEDCLSAAMDSTVINRASELLGKLPKCGKQLQKLAQSCNKGLWSPDMDLSEILKSLKIR